MLASSRAVSGSHLFAHGRQTRYQLRRPSRSLVTRRFKEDSQVEQINGVKEHPGVEASSNSKLLVFLHGKRAGDEGFETAVKALRSEGHEIKVRVTYEAGDIDEFVQEALTSSSYEGYDTLVAAGGDGTLNELVSSLLKNNAPPSTTVALVPMGTANDFAAVNGISQDATEALRLAADKSNIKPIDVGLVNNQVFMNTAAVGTAAEVDPSERASPLKRVLGPLALVVQGAQKVAREGLAPKRNVILRYPVSEEMTRTTGPIGEDEEYTESALEQVERTEALDRPLAEVVGVGKLDQMRRSEPKLAIFSSTEIASMRIREVEVDLLALLAGNSRQIARTIAACPDALLNDGFLDFTLVLGTAQEQLAGIAKDLVSKGLTNAKGKVDYLRLPWMELKSPEPLQINRDGEPEESSHKVVFQVLKQRVRMHLPDERMLVEGQEDPENEAKMGRRMTEGKINEMVTNVETAPGSWSRIRPRIKSFVTDVLLPSLVVYVALTLFAPELGETIRSLFGLRPK